MARADSTMIRANACSCTWKASHVQGGYWHGCGMQQMMTGSSSCTRDRRAGEVLNLHAQLATATTSATAAVNLQQLQTQQVIA